MTALIRKSGSPLYIAAIGASAGGLEALQKLVSHLPGDIKNIAFIVVQHLSPNYKSMLVQSLSSQTRLKVVEVKNTVLVSGGTIYITPPDREITIKKRKLYLTKSPGTHGPRPSIDALLSSLAADQKEKSIGIILSGTGSDGASGIKAIKNRGGVTIVQEPQSAKFNSMPLAAIESGMIDFVLTPEKMGEQLKMLTSEGKNKPVIHSAAEIRDKGYLEIIELLSKETGTDFTNYKHNTLNRRIAKRLTELKLDTTNQYLKFIEKHPEEVEVLYNNMLIGVTSFFRDPAVFRLLEKKLSALVDSKIGTEALRVWAPGCATGEEAYSIGILIAAVLKKKNRVLPVQIFATDINEHALSIARKGVYQQKALNAIPADIIKNYFIRHDGFSEVSKTIRSMILFSKHDLTHNPPFLKLDLIVCRNLLIYFNTRLQEYVFPVFYSALHPNGYLLLGKSESIGQFNDLFSTVHREAKIYQRKAGASLHRIRYTPVKPKQAAEPKTHQYDFSITEMVKETIYKIFEHPYVVINDAMDIQEISGDVSRYIGLKQGQMNANLVKMAHKDLKIELRSLINKCISTTKESKGSIRKIEDGEKEYFVRISVRPLLYSVSPNDFYMVVFEEVKKENKNNPKLYIPVGKDDARRIKELELELDATKDDLQGFVERLENSNSELQSLNEEMQSTNEELKISNEELETANEELQSTNEEINIAYNELKTANEKLETQEVLLNKSEANIQAMLGNTMQAFILIDKEYQIIAYNKVAVQTLLKIWGIKIAEGENFNELLSKKEFQFFLDDFENALKGKVVAAERSVTDKKGKTYFFFFTFTPVLNESKETQCISFSILDITELKTAKSELDRSGKLMDAVFHTADIGIAIVDSKGLFVKVNDGLCKLLGFNQNELTGKTYLKIIASADKNQTILLQEQFLAGKIKDDEKQLICKDGTSIESYITNNLFIDDEGNKFMLKTIRDISESKKYKDLLQEAEKAVKMGGYELDVLNNKLIWTKEMYNIYEVEKDFVPGVGKVIHLYKKESKELIQKLLKDALQHGKNFDTELELIPTGEKRKWVRATGTVKKVQSTIIKLVGTVQDITARKEAELQLERLSFVASKTNNAVIITDASGKIEWVNNSFVNITGFELNEVLGKKPGAVLQGAETDNAVVKKISMRLKKKLPVTEVIKNYRKDGTAFWINMDITPVFKDGKLLNFIGLGIDVTELLKAKEAQNIKEVLEQQQQLFNAIAKNFPDGIIGVLDKNFRYVFAGGTEIKKLGLTWRHLIGEHIFDTLSEKSNAEAEPFLKKAFNGENVIFEEEMHGNTYAINAVPLIFGEKEVEQILVVLYNITKRKKAEQEVWQALIRQKELNELKSKFVSIASHEFRTPLSGILSSAYLISKYSVLNDDEKIQKHIERITGAVRSLTDILNDFLSLGKIEEGKLQNNITDFNVIEFCENLTDEIRPTIKKDQSIIYQHQGKKNIISLDKQHLGHVLTNLLSNAVKYSDEGKRIWLTSFIDKGQIQFTIKDEGVGIPVEDQSHLTNIQGTGMGLHIVKRYLNIMGGTIQFSSTQNKGTTFTIQFPAAKPAGVN
jgi:two-component system CheB/CheR fusion protein